MSTATLTATPVAALPTGDVHILPTVSDDALQAAVAAVSVSGDANKTAAASLARLVLEHYAFHAARYARRVDGVRVLPDARKRDVATFLWLAATGNPSPVPVKERTPGEVSLSQYVSRYARVATDADYGMEALADTETVNAAYGAILDSNREAKANEADAAQALADMADTRAYGEWLTSQTADVQRAFKTVIHALKNDGAPHVHAVVLAVTPIAQAAK